MRTDNEQKCPECGYGRNPDGSFTLPRGFPVEVECQTCKAGRFQTLKTETPPSTVALIGAVNETIDFMNETIQKLAACRFYVGAEIGLVGKQVVLLGQLVEHLATRFNVK